MYLLKSEKIQTEVKSKIVHAVQANASLATIKSIKYTLPENKILENLDNIVYPIYNEQMNLREENEKLTNVRDSLLPKLMSSEIRVPLDN